MRAQYALPPQDDLFPDDLERRAFRYFIEQAGRKTEQVLDGAKNLFTI